MDVINKVLDLTAYKLHKYLQKALGGNIKSVAIVDINDKETWRAITETDEHDLVKVKIKEFDENEVESVPTTEAKLASLGLTKEELKEYLGVK